MGRLNIVPVAVLLYQIYLEVGTITPSSLRKLTLYCRAFLSHSGSYQASTLTKTVICSVQLRMYPPLSFRQFFYISYT
jgi:hypothetical protein